MPDNNDVGLAHWAREAEALALDINRAMRDKDDMVTHAAKLEAAAREMGWAALKLRNKNEKNTGLGLARLLCSR